MMSQQAPVPKTKPTSRNMAGINFLDKVTGFRQFWLPL